MDRTEPIGVALGSDFCPPFSLAWLPARAAPGKHVDHGVVGIIGREVAVNTLDHPKRTVAGDLRHQHRAHAGSQSISDEAVTKQVCIDALLDLCTVRSSCHKLQNATRGERFVVT